MTPPSETTVPALIEFLDREVPPALLKAPSAGVIAKQFRLFLQPDQVVEARFLGVVDDNPKFSYVASGYFDSDHIDVMAKAVASYSPRAEGSFFTFNPVDPELRHLANNRIKPKPKSTTEDHHILRRVWIVVDADPKRISTTTGKPLPPTIPSTDQEHALAYVRLVAVIKWLVEQGWPEPIICDSGNGFHAWFQIDLPCDDKGLVENILKSLNARFSDDHVSIDTSLFNPARLIKIYGSQARKGEGLDERPHRFARVLWAPGDRVLVPETLLQDLAARAPKPKPPKASVNRSKARAIGGVSVAERARKYIFSPGFPDSIAGSNGHGRLYHVACVLVDGFGLTSDQAWPIFVDWNQAKAQPPESEKQLQHKLDDAIKNHPSPSCNLRDAKREQQNQPEGPPSGSDNGQHDTDSDAGPSCFVIPVTPHRHEMLAETLEAIARDRHLYCRGSSLVTVQDEQQDHVKLTNRTTLRGAAGSPTVITLSDAVIGCHLTRNITYVEERKGRDGEVYVVPVHPPNFVVKATATHQHYPGMRPLVGIMECPFPRPDGSIVERRGYDTATGIYYRPAIEFLPLPDRPTQGDAQAAAKRLLSPVGQFPFVRDADHAAWLSGLLTPIGRTAIEGPVPGLALVANKAGTGKGLLIDLIGIAATGRVVPTSNYPVDPIEAGKVKVAIALSAQPLVHFDNLEEGSSYGNSGIDSAMTATVVNDRILGSSRMTGDLPWRACCFLSGNNVSPAKDAFRRWLVCNLFTIEEHPEERNDLNIKNLRAYMLEHRAEFVRDALIILRAHTLANTPTGGWGLLGSFEEWDRVIRGAVWFATGLDCCATLRTAANEAPERLAKIALLAGWRELPGGADSGITVANALKEVHEHTDKFQTLRDALLHFGRKGKPADARSIGNRIRAIKGNLIDGMKFVEAAEEHHAKLWSVTKTDIDSPDSRAHRGVYDSGESAGNSFAGGLHTDNYVNTCGDTCKAYGDGLESDSLDSPDSPTKNPKYRTFTDPECTDIPF
jgi:hypothetical protein